MSHEQLGELAALATAVLWTLSALAWTSAGKQIGVLAVSFLRLVLAVALLMLYGYFSRGMALPLDADRRTWELLGLSGFLGFFVSDLCLFKAFLVIGPRLSLLIYSSLTPLAAVLISWACGGKALGPRSWLGMCVTLAGVLWVVREKGDSPPERIKGTVPLFSHSHRHTREQLRYGLTLAFAATVVQGAAMVLAKDGVGDFDAAASAPDPHPRRHDRLRAVDHHTEAVAGDGRVRAASPRDGYSCRRYARGAMRRSDDDDDRLAGLSRGRGGNDSGDDSRDDPAVLDLYLP